MAGNLSLVWLDQNKQRHEQQMLASELELIVIPPFLPHAVLNTSADNPGILVEFADSPQRDVEMVNII